MPLTVYLPTHITSKKKANEFIKETKQRLARQGVKVRSLEKTDQLTTHGKYGKARVWKLHITKRKKKVTNKDLAKSVGFRKYLPIRHFEDKTSAKLARDFLISARRTLRAKDLKTLYEGKIGKQPVYSLLARTKRQRTMAAKLLKQMFYTPKKKKKTNPCRRH